MTTTPPHERTGTAGVKNLAVSCIVGVYEHERTRPQPLAVDIEVDYDLAAAAATAQTNLADMHALFLGGAMFDQQVRIGPRALSLWSPVPELVPGKPPYSRHHAYPWSRSTIDPKSPSWRAVMNSSTSRARLSTPTGSPKATVTLYPQVSARPAGFPCAWASRETTGPTYGTISPEPQTPMCS